MTGRYLAALILALALGVGTPVTGTWAATRIKDMVSVSGVRPNQIVGYGLIIGLNGTGDSLRNSPFTEQALQSMLDRMGINARTTKPRTKNVAAVIVTAELPAFVRRGSRIDVTVSSLGDATSIAGGSLVMTPLYGPDNEIYAVSQGPVAVTGFVASGQNEKVTQNVPTAGRIPNGALVEREPPSSFGDDKFMMLELLNPDFNTAVRIADVINTYCEERYGVRPAHARDLRSITIATPMSGVREKRTVADRRASGRDGGRGGSDLKHLKDGAIYGRDGRPSLNNAANTAIFTIAGWDPARFLAEIGELTAEPDTPARIVIDERTGTIVIGRDVQISTVAVAQGSITVRVTETPKVSQPNPFSETGETKVVSETAITADQAGGNVAIMKGANLHMLVSGLNRMGLKPPSIIAILQAIKSAGALQADLVVQQ